MIEQDAIIGALLGILSGAAPFLLYTLWRECQQRRIDKRQQAELEQRERDAARKERERQAERKHRETMQELNNQRDTIQRGMERRYGIDIKGDSIAYVPPLTPDSDEDSQG